jgi:tRNA-2-methylthio-N6-dimethylallyladenosine synthase
MKYHIVVYGCQMNTADAERVSAVLENTKYKNTSDISEADLIVVMMCSIRQSAVDRVYGLMEKFKTLRKHKKNLKTVLTGCILKRDKKIFVEGFDYILDIKDIKRLPDILNIKNTLKNKKDYLDIAPKHISKFSANIPIMTGCNNFCSYCVVPYVREREISRTTKEIISEVKNAVKNGYKEIWLLGQNVNSYKDPTTQANFPKLLKMVNSIPGKFWIRFTSSHPKDFNSEVIGAMIEGGNITPYLNLPIQSGDNKVLKAMNRHYSVKEYKNKIKELRKKIPDICLSTDIIVGFPGETKKQFENTVKLFKDVRYDMAYISKYSTRAGTAAAKFKDDVSWEEKKRREKVLTEALRETALKNNKKIIGKESIVLVNENKNNSWFGKNEHYKTIKINSKDNLEGKFVKVKITEASSFTLKGELINE